MGTPTTASFADEQHVAFVSRRPDPAGTVADLLRASPYDVTFLAFHRSLLADLDAIAPSVVIVEHSGDFDLLRLCGDLSTNLAARIIVLADEGPAASPDLQIAALDAGADDFISSDTSASVFMARLRASLRGTLAPGETRQLIVGDVVIDLDARTVLVDQREVRVPHVQYELLVALAARPNRVVGRSMLNSFVWSKQTDPTGSSHIRVAASALRRTLGTGPSGPRIESVPNVGYRLVVDSALPIAL